MVLKLTSAPARVGVAVFALITSLACGAYAFDNLTSDSIFVASREGSFDTPSTLAAIDYAVKKTPLDGQAWFKHGSIYLDNVTGPEADIRQATAVASLQKAAALSPEDWRIQVKLGQALSHAGEIDQARSAFQHALALAPNYYEPHWNYGNFLLRNGDADNAFVEFKTALEARPFELPLIFEYAWNAFDGDVNQVLASLKVPLESRPMLAGLLVAKGKITEGMDIWKQVTAPVDIRGNARNFVNNLMAARAWGPAYEVWKAVPGIPNPKASVMDADALDEDNQWFAKHNPEQGSLLSNGDFEADLRSRNFAPFLDFRVGAIGGLSLARDSEQHQSGVYSLRMNFDVPGNAAFSVLEQTVPVTPGAKYTLSYQLKTESLTSLSTPVVEIYDPADTAKLRVASKPFPLNTTPWEETKLEFTVPASTPVVVVRVLRPSCGEPPCPIIGKVWIDGIRLSQN